MSATRIAGAAGVGLLAGGLSGLFGVGGGILIVPGLVLILGMGQRMAHGTSLAAILPIAVSGVTAYALEGAVDWPAAALIVAGSAGGAVLGTYALRRLSQELLRLLFGVFLLLTAARLLINIQPAAGRSDLDLGMALALVLVGILSGTLAGLLGVGGGIVIVPALVILFSVPDAVAKGTSLAVIIPTALVGTLRNTRHRGADLSVALLVGLFGVASAFIGSKVALGLEPRLSNILFAGLLFLVAARLLIRVPVRGRAPASPQGGGPASEGPGAP